MICNSVTVVFKKVESNPSLVTFYIKPDSFDVSTVVIISNFTSIRSATITCLNNLKRPEPAQRKTNTTKHEGWNARYAVAEVSSISNDCCLILIRRFYSDVRFEDGFLTTFYRMIKRYPMVFIQGLHHVWWYKYPIQRLFWSYLLSIRTLLLSKLHLKHGPQLILKHNTSKLGNQSILDARYIN